MYFYYYIIGNLVCNWKLLVDGGLEGYYFKIVYVKMIGFYFLDNMSLNVENRLYSSIIFLKCVLKKMEDVFFVEWEFRKGVNILFYIFFSMIILIELDYLMVVCLFFIDEKIMQFKFFMLVFFELIIEKEKKYWDLNVNIFWNVINEDNEMVILQQQSFNGYLDIMMIVGSYEKLLVQFEYLVDVVLEGKFW